ncbi:cytochrome P450 [Stereum hirsutum FP-91666 SS1]|uniref:cytochrome P450 n=1 Tax=Stereum hirsutum (strain FP-91666) TaxID=721885 RepID=UPI000440CA90|nr:cytochrome P450 [Stereum hirsutum FP-91666 SS1]EIM88804.1 cytochrome P450 [Stereum hirsutum FP-91666 SS1]
MSSIRLLDAGLFGLAAVLLYKVLSRKSGLPLPPGPKGWPLIGNALEFPSSKAWTTFAKWGEQWGGIMSINVMGQTIIIVNDPQIAVNLLDKAGSELSDRPVLPMASLCGWDRVLSAARAGPRLREIRKLIGRVIGTRGSLVKFYPSQDYQATMFLKRVMDDPTKLDEATRKTAGAMVLHITYGYKIQEEGVDPLVGLADRALSEFSAITTPGAFLVDMMPALKYVPDWFPGASFKQQAKKYHKSCDDLADVPLNWIRGQIAKGEAGPSYTHDLLMDKNISEERMERIKWSSASFYGAGADTSVSVIYSYFLATTLYPEVEKKAHAEIDSVIGRDRLPGYEDRASLPYVNAICKELLRWLPIVPLAVPHRATRDIIFDDYSIPEGSLVMANCWKFLHDPDVYRDPFTFNPDRFMGPEPEQDPADFCFGFGRRVCPGTHLADASIYIAIVKAVSAFSVSKAIGPDGKEIIPVADTTEGVIVRPKPFECNVKPRHEKIPQLVADVLAHHEAAI